MSQNQMKPAMTAATASPRYDRTAAAILDAAARVLADRGASANMAAAATTPTQTSLVFVPTTARSFVDRAGPPLPVVG